MKNHCRGLKRLYQNSVWLVKIGTGFDGKHARAVITACISKLHNAVQRIDKKIDGWPLPSLITLWLHPVG
jgi:hypothetical protein